MQKCAISLVELPQNGLLSIKNIRNGKLWQYNGRCEV